MLMALALSAIESEAIGAEKTQVRLYKINKYGQGHRVWFTTKQSRLFGCHNLKMKSTTVHRLVHFGFESCTLFSAKDCAPGSEVTARLGDDEPEQTVLTEGHSWFLGVEEKDEDFAKYTKDERGKTVRSWRCNIKN